MKVFIKTMSGDSIPIEINSEDTIDSLKQKIEQKEGLKKKSNSLYSFEIIII